MRLHDITLRLARRADAPTLAAMSRDLIESGLGWHYRTERVTALLRDPETVTVVADDVARTVGFAIMGVGDERAHLVLLAVHPRYQRRGIGARMTHWLVETAATAGMASVHVELRARNAAAHALYGALDFTETRRVSGYYRRQETAILMMRLLRPAALAPQVWSPPPPEKR